ncbi:MAG TPA: alkaline phosphatase PhoX [Burkholderiaceae bacterium]|nr:alkaline phosphatase PhoX [Burkholderiaceae bacterium]
MLTAYARKAGAAACGGYSGQVTGPYGPPAPVRDQSTGLPLLQLPTGFQYTSFSWSGDAMADGRPCPDRHDGMAVVATRRVDGGEEHVLIRNHERALGSALSMIAAPGQYDTGTIGGRSALGGTTNLVFRDGNWMSVEPSLGGTLVNCAGGPTPWGSWLTCEETLSNEVSTQGRRHGYVFEVAANASQTSGNPILGMGRFSHEAAAVDPATGYVYLTEDLRNASGFYRFIPTRTRGALGSLEDGGRLQAARVVGKNNASLIVARRCDEYTLEWIDIANPDQDAGPVEGPSLPGFDPTSRGSGPFSQAWAAGALQLARGEGLWCSGGKMYLVDTATGVDAINRSGRGRGALWELDLTTMKLKAVFVSGNQLIGNNPDNVTLSPRGGVLLCEDGGGVADAYGVGTRMLGITAQGDSFIFGKNNIELTAAQIAGAHKNITPGNYREYEFAGACWEPSGRVLFCNIQTPGITFAIWGPWGDVGI